MYNIEHMTLQQKVGQMLLCGFQGLEPSQEVTDLIMNHSIGGVIYFSRNIQEVKQVYNLSKKLQELALSAEQPPLIISIDQEGGMVARIVEGVSLPPGNMALGATREAEGAYQAAKIVGKEMRALGINMNYAPSVDIYNNRFNPVIGVRSYGEKPELVSEMGIATMRGFQEEGLSATIKHFPGHGDTDIDSHIELPIIKHARERIHQVELVPFKRAIETDEGPDAIMTAHILFSDWDEEVPSTLSRKLIQEYLRQELRYEGVVITDCLEMQAVEQHYGPEEAVLLAVEAGVDLLLYSHSYQKQVAAIHTIVKAVEQGRITEERINQSVRRILALKSKRNMSLIPNTWDLVRSQLRQPESIQIITQLSEKSITVVKGEERLPLDSSEEVYCIWPELAVTTDVDEIFAQSQTLGQKLKEQGMNITERIITTNPNNEEVERFRICRQGPNR